MLSTQQPTSPRLSPLGGRGSPAVTSQLDPYNAVAREPSPSSDACASPQPGSPTASPSRGGKAAVTPATVIAWLREHYKLGKHGYSKKAAVFAHYQALCTERGSDASISPTFFGKLVKRAFPEIKTIRKGPRGKVEQCYDRLKPVDPAKAARARWLERMNLYIAALNSSTTTTTSGPAVVKEEPMPAAAHSRLQCQSAFEEAYHANYASALDGGSHGFLASLLPSVDVPSSSSSFSSPAPSSPTTETATTVLPPHRQEREQGHYYGPSPAHFVHLQHPAQERSRQQLAVGSTSRSAYLASAALSSSMSPMGYPHRPSHHHEYAAYADVTPYGNPYGALLTDPSSFYSHHAFPVYN